MVFGLLIQQHLESCKDHEECIHHSDYALLLFLCILMELHMSMHKEFQ